MPSRPSAMAFIDCDNYSLLRNSSESYIDSEFPTRSALVYWWFLGDSAFPEKLSPCLGSWVAHYCLVSTKKRNTFVKCRTIWRAIHLWNLLLLTDKTQLTRSWHSSSVPYPFEKYSPVAYIALLACSPGNVETHQGTWRKKGDLVLLHRYPLWQ